MPVVRLGAITQQTRYGGAVVSILMSTSLSRAAFAAKARGGTGAIIEVIMLLVKIATYAVGIGLGALLVAPFVQPDKRIYALVLAVAVCGIVELLTRGKFGASRLHTTE